MLIEIQRALCRVLGDGHPVVEAAGLLAFVRAEQMGLPVYHRWPIVVLTLAFGLAGLFRHGRMFDGLSPTQQGAQVARWRRSRFGPARLLIRFYHGLVILKVYQAADQDAVSTPPPLQTLQTPPVQADIVVVGSGPGGAMTAALLAEAGHQVVLVEDGAQGQTHVPFSTSEMQQKLRYGGLGVMFGGTPISYIEGRCVGGGSEISNGLYLRPMDPVLAAWERDFGLKQCRAVDLDPLCARNEADLGVARFDGQHPKAGLKLAEGAQKMGWAWCEAAKWRRYDPGAAWHDGSRAPYASMGKSFVPRFVDAGGRLVTDCFVRHVKPEPAGWRLTVAHHGQRRSIAAKTVFLAAGAVQTPAVLRRSAMRTNIGNSLESSLIIKVVARFDHPINFEAMGMPVQLVDQFAPKMTFGCGISSRAQLALALSGYDPASYALEDDWQSMAVYTVILSGQGRGRVRTPVLGALLWQDAPVVSYQLADDDWRDLAQGLKRLSHLLLAAGATHVYPVLQMDQPITEAAQVDALPDHLGRLSPQIIALHLCGSCPMGENRARCATDSFGRVHGFDNLYINDASLLGGYPGSNPQGTLMAIARRNVEHFLRDNPATK